MASKQPQVLDLTLIFEMYGPNYVSYHIYLGCFGLLLNFVYSTEKAPTLNGKRKLPLFVIAAGSATEDRTSSTAGRSSSASRYDLRRHPAIREAVGRGAGDGRADEASDTGRIGDSCQ